MKEVYTLAQTKEEKERERERARAFEKLKRDEEVEKP